MEGGLDPDAAAQELERLLAGRLIQPAFQPIVDLRTRRVVAYEALARGPKGSPLAFPDVLFATAHATGELARLDWACRVAALSSGLDAGLRPPHALFVNVEPEALGEAPDAPSADVLRRATSELRVFAEITERALTDRPAQLLRATNVWRERGWGVALDDVGADPRSLALLPLVRPDVVKLDRALVHAHPSRASGEVMNGVRAYAEATGAVVLAEGIEEEGHLLAAETLGATLAQGWHFGRPGPLPATLPELNGSAPTLGLTARSLPPSPVALVERHREMEVGRKDLLLSVTRALEGAAERLSEHAVVVSCFQDARHFTEATHRRYERLARDTAFVAALGVGMDPEPAPGVRGAHLDDGDPLHGEWDVAVLGPHFAGALVAYDLGDEGPDAQRRFAFTVTFDRDLVIDVAASLMTRVVARA